MNNFPIPLPFFVKKVKSPRRRIRVRRPTRKAVRFFFTMLFALAALTSLFFIWRNQKPAEAAWFNDLWMYRKTLTIDYTKVSGGADLTNFPALISVTDTNLRDYAQSDGDDILFTTLGGDKLNHEIESYTSATGVLIAWVKIPTLSASTNTVIYMYYGNPSAADQSRKTDVWDSNYASVYHLKEDPTVSAPQMLNSKNNTKEGTVGGTWAGGDLLPGQIGNALNFDKAQADYVSMIDHHHGNNITVSAWIKGDELNSDWETIAQRSDSGSWFDWQLYARAADSSRAANRSVFRTDFDDDGAIDVATEEVDSGGALSTATWYYLTATYNGTSLIYYLNGSATHTVSCASCTITDSNNPIWIGANSQWSEPFDGIIDEFRVSTSARSAGWITTEYNNQYSPATFLTSGTQEASPGPTAYWKFDEGQGQTVNDSTQNTNSGTLGASDAADTDDPIWTTEDMCVFGKCLKFGGNDFINLTMNHTFQTATICTWIKAPTQTDPDGFIYTQNNVGNTANLAFYLDRTSHKVNFGIWNGSTMPVVTSTSNIDTNNWFHVCGTRNGANFAIYVNGKLENSISNGNTTNAGTLTSIGRNRIDNANFLTGFLDDFKIYSYVRSADQIKTDYNSRNSTKGSSANLGNSKDNNLGALANGLVGYWKMDETSGNAIDSSGNNTTLTNSGTTTFVSGQFGNAFSDAAINSTLTLQPDAAAGKDTVLNKSYPTWNYGTAQLLILQPYDSTIIKRPLLYFDVSSIPANATVTSATLTLYLDSLVDAGTISVDIQEMTRSWTEDGANWATYDGTNTWTTAGGDFSAPVIGTTSVSTAGTSYDWSLTPSVVANWRTTNYGIIMRGNPEESTINQRYFASSDYAIPSLRPKLVVNYTLPQAYLSSSSVISGVKTVAFWIKPTSNTSYPIDLNGTQTITASAGVITANNFTDPATAIYVNGVASTTLTAGVWQHVVVTSNTGFNTGTMTLGKVGSDYINGNLDEVRYYNRALSSKEVSDLYNWAPGPVGYWKMDENTGGYAYDSSGNSNTGTITAGTGGWAPGKYGSAYNFDNANTQINAQSGSTLDNLPASGMTIETWIRPNSQGEGSAGIIMAKNVGVTPNAGWLLQFAGTNALTFTVDGSTDLVRTTSNSVVTLNAWNHVTVTWDGIITTASNVHIYVNGIEVTYATTTNGAARVDDDTSSFYMGNDSGQAATFDGKIDDARVYNYARSAKQITEDMLGSPKPVSGGGGNAGQGAIGYWKFDEGYLTTAYNSGNQESTLNGTLTNMASPASAVSGWTNSGKFGKALLFDPTGSADYVAMPSDLTALKITSDLTLSAWINVVSFAAERDIICKYTGTAATSAYCLYTNTSGNLVMSVVNSTGPAIVTTTGTKVLSTATWYHVVGTFSSANSVNLYVNGILDQNNTTSIPTTLQDPTTILDIGAENAGSNPFNGTIDEPKIYNFALTADEIKMDYNRGQTIQLGALSDTSQVTGTPIPVNSAQAEYCIPGDATACAAPVGEWKFEEGSGNSVNDTSGSNNTGSWQGTLGNQWTTGKIGKAGNFNGSNNYVQVADASNLNGMSGLTIEAWVYKRSKDIKIAGKWKSAAPIAEQYIFRESGGNIQFYTYTSSQIGGNTSLTGSAGWHHYAATYNGVIMKAYKDGILGSTTYNQSGSILPNSGSNLIIGAEYDASSPSDQFTDNFRIFNYARTPAQIAWDYNRGGPVGWWKMDECTGTTIYNAAPTASGAAAGMNGTLTLSGNAAGTCTLATTTDAWYLGASGKYNSALGLDGNDYVTVTDTASYAFTAATQNFSASAWIKRAAAGVNHFVISKEDAANDGWNMQITSGNLVSCAVNNKVFTSTSTIDTNWHHIVCVVSRAGNGQVYIDGRADGTAVAISSTAMAIASTTTTIGVRNYTPADTYFNGLIDDIRIYNYALTPLQVKLLYNQNSAVRFGPVTGIP